MSMRNKINKCCLDKMHVCTKTTTHPNSHVNNIHVTARPSMDPALLNEVGCPTLFRQPRACTAPSLCFRFKCPNSRAAVTRACRRRRNTATSRSPFRTPTTTTFTTAAATPTPAVVFTSSRHHVLIRAQTQHSHPFSYSHRIQRSGR
jgi:hypothetical protein